jgi:hypothetical protein
MKQVGGTKDTPSLYVSFQAIVSMLEKFQPMLGAMEIPVVGEPGGLRRAMEGLGVGSLTSLSVASVPGDGGFRTTSFLRSPGLGKGNVAAEKPLTDADLRILPRAPSWATIARFDLVGLYKQSLDGIEKISPDLFTMVAGMLGMFEQQIGMSIADDILGSFEDTWAIFDAPEHGGFWVTGLTVIAKVKEKNQIDTLLQAAVDMAAGLSGDREAVTIAEEQYRGKTIRYASFSGMPIPVAPAWAQHEGYWVFALYPQVVRIALDRLLDHSASILDNPDFERGRKLLPEKASSLSYVDTPAGVRQVYPFALLLGQIGAAMARGEGVPVDITVLPSQTTLTKHLFGDVSATAYTPEGVMTVSHGPLPFSVPSLAAGGMVVPMMAGIMLPSLARARMLAKRSVSASNLRSIGTGCHTYANLNDDRFPPDLQTLMDEGDLAPQVLRSPLDDSDDESSYIYIPGQTTGGNSQNILAYEKLENNDWEGTNVLFIDAHVDWMSAEDFEEALEATQQRLRSGSEEAELKP